MTRRKAKKAFKKKWNAPDRLALWKTVPKELTPRICEAMNTAFEKKFAERIDDAILFGTGRQIMPREIRATDPIGVYLHPEGSGT